jgi:hypothetical protein
MNQYLIYYNYRLEHGLSAVEQKAADRRRTERAAASAVVRGAVGRSVWRGLGVRKAPGGAARTSKRVSVAAGQAGH